MTVQPEPRSPEAPRHGPISLLLRIVFGLLALAIPLFAIWLAAAMLRAANAPVWLAASLGVTLVLVLPFVWDLWAEARFLRRQNPPPRILTRADRLRLRILAVSIAFSGFVLFAFGPSATGALVRHGDWVLFGSEGPFAQDFRAGVAKFASTLGHLNGAEPPVSTTQTAPGTPLPEDATPTRSTPPPPPASDRPISGVPQWPLPAEVHPVILGLGPVSSIAEVGEAIRKREADPFQRVKAIHDFAVTWLTYDSAALDPDYAIPDQSGEAVFRRKTATCNGYVALMLAVAEVTGDKLTRIAGRSRVDSTSIDGFRHAWIAATIDGRSYLIDPTWNAGAVFGLEFRPRYTTSYLFAPPDIFAYDHLPDDPAWSLLDPPLTTEAFLARPALTAHFFAWGLTLEGINRARTTVSGRVTFRIKNPRKAWIIVLARPENTHGRTYNCLVPSQAELLEVNCPVTPGPWSIQLLANSEEGGNFPTIGSLSVDSQ